MIPVTAGKKTANTCQNGTCSNVAAASTVAVCPKKKRQQRQGDPAHDEVLGSDCHPGGNEGNCGYQDGGHQTDDAGVEDREHPGDAFCEPDCVEGDGKRLGKVERYPYRPADLDSQRPADHVVRPTRPDSLIGGDLADGKARQEGDDGGDRDDDQRTGQPGLADHPAKAQVHDDAEDGENRGCEDSTERAETRRVFLVPLRCCAHRCTSFDMGIRAHEPNRPQVYRCPVGRVPNQARLLNTLCAA